MKGVMGMDLRTRVRNLKETGFTYTSITKELGWGRETLYKWLKGEFELKQEKETQLENLLDKYNH